MKTTILRLHERNHVLLSLLLCFPIYLFTASPSFGQSVEQAKCWLTISKLHTALDEDLTNIKDFDLDYILKNADHRNLYNLISVIAETTAKKQPDDFQIDYLKTYYVPTLISIAKRLAEEDPYLSKMRLGRKIEIEDDWNFILRYDHDRAVREYFMNIQNLCITMVNSILTNQQLKTTKANIPNADYNNLHYIEQAIYGNNKYTEEILGDSLPKGVQEKICKVFDLTYLSPHSFSEAVHKAYNEDNHALLKDNLQELLLYTITYIPNCYQNEITSILGSNKLFEDPEILVIVKNVLSLRYGEEVVSNYFETFLFQNKGIGIISAFLETREQLKAENKEFANYLPWNCPEELTKTEGYEDYLSVCVSCISQCLKLLTANSSTSSLDELSTLNNFFQTFECDDLPDFLIKSLALGLTTVRDEYEARDIIDDVVLLTHWKGCAYSPKLMEAAADHYYYETKNTERAKQILDTFVLPYLRQCEYSGDDLIADLETASGTISLISSCTSMRNEYSSTADSLVRRIEPILFNEDSGIDSNIVIYGIGCLSDYYLRNQCFDKVSEIIAFANKYCNDPKAKAWLRINLFNIYYYNHDYKNAWKVSREIDKDGLYSSYCQFLAEKFECAVNLGKKNEASKLGTKVIETLYHELENFLFLDSNDRETYWRGKRDEVYTPLVMSMAVAMDNGNKELADIVSQALYDWNLISKGLLLNADNRIDIHMRNHPDSLVRNRYIQFRRLSSQLENDKLYKSEDQVQNGILKAMAQRDVLTAVRTMGKKATMDDKIQWRDIQRSLKPGEVAVEFAHTITESEDGESTENGYYGLIIRSGYKFPKCIPLCFESEINEAIGRQKEKGIYYNPRNPSNPLKVSKALYDLIWSPFEEYIEEGETVYFSLDGNLHLYNLEILCGPDGRQADEYFDLRRLSSTRELCLNKTYPTVQNAVLYGNLNYNMGKEELIKLAEKYPVAVSRGASSSDGVPRKPLPQTETEVLNIQAMLENKGIAVECYMGDNGVEESFKSLSGKNINILHLATHGFYSEAVRDEENLSPMVRAGLVMSSAPLCEKYNKEDGIIRAIEVADMDLSSVSLVVLSACQTGLGKVTEDGVFGMQRGFKQAGAGTMVMTLWEVDSEMTQSMIERFYANLLAGDERHVAFRKARHEAKVQYPDRDWAAFIMLD